MTIEQSIAASLAVIAMTGIYQTVWGVLRDTQFLKKNNEALAWDNERTVLIGNHESAEKELGRYKIANSELAMLLGREQKKSRKLGERLTKHGIDDTD